MGASRYEIKTRRLNLMISEPLYDRTVLTAKVRGVSVSEYIRSALESELRRSQDDGIEEAADRLAGFYESGDDLTAFTSLDSEEFL